MNLKTFMYKVRSMRRARLVHVALFLVVAVFFFQFFANTSRVSATPPYTLISQSTPIPDFQFTIRDGAGVVYTVNQDVGDPNLVYFRDSAGFDCSIVIWGYPKDATDGATARIADGQTVEDRNCAGNDSGDFESNFGTIDRSVTINGSPTSPGGGGAGETADITETCESRNPGLGWLLCKVMQFSVSVLDALTIGDSNEEGGQGFLGNILNFDLAGGQQDALRTVWSGFRVLANSLFAIIFLLVIYAAATGNGIGPYNLKRLLPRLIISAITVQLSFSISIILLDLFNSFGRGASSLILSPLPDEAFNNFIGDVPFVNQLGALALSALFLLLTIVVVALAIVGILIMGAVFILRNIGLVMLIILSPIAFALWVLPNTERIFRKWWEWFIQLLAIFPLAAMLLASGRLVSYVWIGASEGGGNEQVGEGGIGAALIATLAIFLPYYLGPRLFQFAGGVIGRVGNTAQGMQRNLENREFMQRGKARTQARLFKGADNVREKLKDPDPNSGRLRKTMSRAANSKMLGSEALNRYSARAQSRFDQMKDEEITAARTLIRNRVSGMSNDERREYYRDVSTNKNRSEPEKVVALREMVTESDGFGLERALTSGSVSPDTWRKFMDRNGGDVHEKFRQLSTGSFNDQGIFEPGYGTTAKSTAQDFVGMKPEAITSSIASLQTAIERGRTAGASNEAQQAAASAERNLSQLKTTYSNEVLTNPNLTARLDSRLRSAMDGLLQADAGQSLSQPQISAIDSINDDLSILGKRIQTTGQHVASAGATTGTTPPPQQTGRGQQTQQGPYNPPTVNVNVNTPSQSRPGDSQAGGSRVQQTFGQPRTFKPTDYRSGESGVQPPLPFEEPPEPPREDNENR